MENSFFFNFSGRMSRIEVTLCDDEIVEENGWFNVERGGRRHGFRTRQEAEWFADGYNEDSEGRKQIYKISIEKVDKRKNKSRRELNIEYTDDTTSTEKHATCKICIKMLGHIPSLSVSDTTLKWNVSEDHQEERKLRQREEMAVSRHLKKKVAGDTIDELHKLYHKDPDRFAMSPPSPPKHKPLTSRTLDSALGDNWISYGNEHDLDPYIVNLRIKEEEKEANYWRCVCAEITEQVALLAVAMQEDADSTPVDIRKQATRVLSRFGLDRPKEQFDLLKESISKLEIVLCKFTRTDVIDAAIECIQNIYWKGSHKEKFKNTVDIEKMKRYCRLALEKHSFLHLNAKEMFGDDLILEKDLNDHRRYRCPF